MAFASSLVRRLQSNRVGTGLIRPPGGMSPSSPMSAGGGLADKLRRAIAPMAAGSGGGISQILRQKLSGGSMMKRPEIRPVSPVSGGIQAPMQPPSAVQQPSLGSGLMPGSSGLRDRLRGAFQRGVPALY